MIWGFILGHLRMLCFSAMISPKELKQVSLGMIWTPNICHFQSFTALFKWDPESLTSELLQQALNLALFTLDLVSPVVLKFGRTCSVRVVAVVEKKDFESQQPCSPIYSTIKLNGACSGSHFFEGPCF